MTDSATDMAAMAQAGIALRTRDRRDVTVTAVDAASGRITGIVPMVGPCHWQRDGRYEGAGSAGPLDLVPRAAVAESQQHALLKDALGDPAAKNACCD